MNTASQINVEKLPYTINSGPLGGKSSSASHYINSKSTNDSKCQKSNHKRTRNFGRITFQVHSVKGP